MMMKIVIYSSEYKSQLEELLIAFSKEIYGEGTVNLDDFIDYHWAIYLAVDSNNLVIGFSSYMFNDWFGLRKQTIGNTYVYIRPKYRGGNIVAMFIAQSIKISRESNCELENYYASENTKSIANKLVKNGKEIYSTYIYSVSDCIEAENKINKISRRIYK